MAASQEVTMLGSPGLADVKVEVSEPSTTLKEAGSRELPRMGTGASNSMQILHIPRDFNPKPGVQLTEGLFIGKSIAHGLQGGVYDLVDATGQPVDVVVKVVHKHALLAEVEREWEVGSRLAFLAEADGSLPGFMGTGAALRDTSKKFRGMILERLSGRCVDKVICTPGFADVQYIHDMLKSVFTALEHAQSWLGFHHSDLRLANVMEIVVPPGGVTANGTPRQATPTERCLSQRALTEQGRPGTITDRYRYQFKIIDYGLANFSETYACGPDVVMEERIPSGSDVGDTSPGLRPSRSRCVLLMRSKRDLQADEVPRLPRTSPIEKLYRYMWRRKGDVFHLLHDLGEWLDGRVWPRTDELEVLRLRDLIRHVTGVKVEVYFYDNQTLAGGCHSGWQDVVHCGLFKRDGAALHFLRRWHVRLRSWTNPSNPGLTGAEALTAPFFTKHCSLRTVVRGGSARYATWTRPKQKHRGRSM